MCLCVCDLIAGSRGLAVSCVYFLVISAARTGWVEGSGGEGEGGAVPAGNLRPPETKFIFFFPCEWTRGEAKQTYARFFGRLCKNRETVLINMSHAPAWPPLPQRGRGKKGRIGSPSGSVNVLLQSLILPFVASIIYLITVNRRCLTFCHLFSCFISLRAAKLCVANVRDAVV